jgi:hypothetical protein
MSEVPAQSVTVKELDDLVEAIFQQKNKIKEMDALTSIENVKLSSMEAKAVAYLEELGREKYPTKYGTIYVQEQWRFPLPKTDEDKAAFFGYLKEQGLFDKYATVNSASYNSYLNAEWEIAKEEGRGMEFKLPGVPEPTFFRKLGTRKS